VHEVSLQVVEDDLVAWEDALVDLVAPCTLNMAVLDQRRILECGDREACVKVDLDHTTPGGVLLRLPGEVDMQRAWDFVVRRSRRSRRRRCGWCEWCPVADVHRREELRNLIVFVATARRSSAQLVPYEALGRREELGGVVRVVRVLVEGARDVVQAS